MKNNLENFNFNENTSELKIAMENFIDFVIDSLEKKGELRIAESIQTGKINLKLQQNRILNIGLIAENYANKNETVFDSTEFLLREAEKVANELISQKK